MQVHMDHEITIVHRHSFSDQVEVITTDGIKLIMQIYGDELEIRLLLDDQEQMQIDSDHVQPIITYHLH